MQSSKSLNVCCSSDLQASITKDVRLYCGTQIEKYRVSGLVLRSTRVIALAARPLDSHGALHQFSADAIQTHVRDVRRAPCERERHGGSERCHVVTQVRGRILDASRLLRNEVRSTFHFRVPRLPKCVRLSTERWRISVRRTPAKLKPNQKRIR